MNKIGIIGRRKRSDVQVSVQVIIITNENIKYQSRNVNALRRLMTPDITSAVRAMPDKASTVGLVNDDNTLVGNMESV